tara:strand:- start:62 stop:559 length:498 start_codon:yes stop_codon:yes gene_type:complete
MSNKFIQDNIDLIKQFEELSSVNDNGKLQSLIPELMKEYNQCVPPIVNKLKSSFALHTVYVVETNLGLKVGYTINTIEQRFNEQRYTGQLKLKKILKDDKFPSLGAYEFEKQLKYKYEKYRKLNSNTTAPGKGEIYYIKYKKEILKIYDELKDKYKNKRGYKRPN